MAFRAQRVSDWLDSRTGFRSARAHLLDERLPPGIGWAFTLGSILLGLLTIQWLTGIALTMYYVPSPDHAYDSLRYLASEVRFGGMLRALHFFGASVIVVFAGLHLLRVVVFGSYKGPREMTWISGVVLLLIVLAFALSGYLLPWDQRAYWATVVTLNIARSAPIVGGWVAGVMQGGDRLGALTLGRWYAMHVMVLPAALASLVAAHIYLMRRHGISGPVRPREGSGQAFYPYHALKDSVAVAVVVAALITVAWVVPVPLELQADPADQTYIPRPEWYFLSLFQLLKYFPGRLEPIASVVVPVALFAGLLLLPFMDRGSSRRLRDRPAVALSTGIVLFGVLLLTAIGWRDRPAPLDPNRWSPTAIAGKALADDSRCTRCHTTGGVAAPLDAAISRDDQWIVNHVADPEMIAPNLRPRPPHGFTKAQAQAIVAFARKVRAGIAPQNWPTEERQVAMIFAIHCSRCHVIDGVGGDEGPNLSHVGRTHDRPWLATLIADPSEIDVNATMPAFDDKLEPAEIQAMAGYLASRR